MSHQNSKIKQLVDLWARQSFNEKIFPYLRQQSFLTNHHDFWSCVKLILKSYLNFIPVLCYYNGKVVFVNIYRQRTTMRFIWKAVWWQRIFKPPTTVFEPYDIACCTTAVKWKLANMSATGKEATTVCPIFFILCISVSSVIIVLKSIYITNEGYRWMWSKESHWDYLPH